MKAFQLLTLTALLPLLAAAHQDGAGFDLHTLPQPVTLQEMLAVAGFVAFVGGGVFLAIRWRDQGPPPTSLR